MALDVPLDTSQIGREARTLETDLRKLIVGQNEAIEQIVNIFQMHRTGMCAPDRPIGSFLFLGPTGSGKTRIVEATAESLVKTSRAVVKIDCAEFQHDHEIAKIIGSPPGYLGHRETHPRLSQGVLNMYHTSRVRISFVLFDEIEKASDALWNLLLGILDKATLTLGDNRQTDFSQTMVFMTSNLGAREMESSLNPKFGLGVGQSKIGMGDDKLRSRIAKSGIEAARRKFLPEFMNRLDKIVVFRPLGAEELLKVLDIELNFVQRRIIQNLPRNCFIFSATPAAKQLLLDEGADARYGARHLKRAIERLLVQPLSNLIATGQAKAGDLINVDANGNQRLEFGRRDAGLTFQMMAYLVQEDIKELLLTAAIAAEQPQRFASARV